MRQFALVAILLTALVFPHSSPKRIPRHHDEPPWERRVRVLHLLSGAGVILMGGFATTAAIGVLTGKRALQTTGMVGLSVATGVELTLTILRSKAVRRARRHY